MPKIGKILDKHRKEKENRKMRSEMYQQVVRMEDSEEYSRLSTNGIQALEDQDYEDALRWLGEAILLSGGKCFWDFYHRGMALQALKRHEEAVEAFSRAITLESREEKCYFFRGVSLLALGRYQESISDFSMAIGMRPEKPIAYFNRGFAYDRIGQSEKALEDYGKAIESAPDLPLSYNNRGLIYTKQGEFGRALSDLQHALELSPEEPHILNNLGYLYMKRAEPGDSELALELFEKVLVLDPGFLSAYENRAKLYRQLGQIDLAERDEEKLRALKQPKET